MAHLRRGRCELSAEFVSNRVAHSVWRSSLRKRTVAILCLVARHMMVALRMIDEGAQLLIVERRACLDTKRRNRAAGQTLPLDPAQ